MEQLRTRLRIPRIEIYGATYRTLNTAAQKEYCLTGDATHAVETPLGETVLLFPKDQDGGRPFLLFQDARMFLQRSRLEGTSSENFGAWPEEGTLWEWEDHENGDVSVGTNITL